MNIIYRKRNSGKTTELIKRAAECNGHIVCHPYQIISIMKDADKMGLNIPKPISYGEFIDKDYYGKGVDYFLIDDVELLLERLTTVKITDITISENDKINRTPN